MGSPTPERDLTLEAATDIRAAPAQVWSVVSDLRRMGEWSPECRRMHVFGEVRVGARSLGINRRGLVVWPTNSTITRYEPERAIAWRVLESRVEWSYELQPTPTGTRLVERRAAPRGLAPLSKAFGQVFLGGAEQHDDELLAGMRATLARMRTEVERG